MAADVHSREQRLRKQAELQSLYTNLASLREREASYIEASATIPELLVYQLTELRQQIKRVESELLTLSDQSIQSPARQFYREAFEAELARDFDKALSLYKKAARHAHPDAGAAARSIRYLIKTAKDKSGPAGKRWTPQAGPQSRNRWLIGLVTLLILATVVIFAVSGFFAPRPPDVAAVEPTSTATLTPPAVILIVPDTATPILTNTPTETAVPPLVDTPQPTPTGEDLPTETPTPTPTLRAAPKILEPKDGLVWIDGAIVFEFARLDLAYDELYCLNTLKGFDKNNTENWSFTPKGSKEPSIPIEANIFRLAKIQGMRCIVWSASIGKGSCENIISESTAERVIGLPRPCDFK